MIRIVVVQRRSIIIRFLLLLATFQFQFGLFLLFGVSFLSKSLFFFHSFQSIDVALVSSRTVVPTQQWETTVTTTTTLIRHATIRTTATTAAHADRTRTPSLAAVQESFCTKNPSPSPNDDNTSEKHHCPSIALHILISRRRLSPVGNRMDAVLAQKRNDTVMDDRSIRSFVSGCVRVNLLEQLNIL